MTEGTYTVIDLTDTADEPEHVPDRDLTELGTVGGFRYLKHRDGRELIEVGPVSRSSDLKAGAIVRGPVAGRTSTGERYSRFVRLRAVPVGTYERRMAHATRDRTRPVVHVDALAQLNRRVPATPLVLDDPDDGTVTAPIARVLKRRGRPVTVGGRDPLASIENVIARLTRRGVKLTASPDGAHLLVEAAALKGPDRELIVAYRDLLLPYLNGKPATCATYAHLAGKAPVAATLGVGGAPLCAECAGIER